MTREEISEHAALVVMAVFRNLDQPGVAILVVRRAQAVSEERGRLGVEQTGTEIQGGFRAEGGIVSERIRSMQLGVDKVLALEARVAELEAENAKLRKCVEPLQKLVEFIELEGPASMEWKAITEWTERGREALARAEVDKP